MSAFHQGELDVQARAGERATAEQVSRMIGNEVMRGARPFVDRVRTVAFTTRSLWPEVWLGEGLLSTENGREVTVHRPIPDGEVGMLAIDLETRKRLRINGVARDGVVTVRESYPNCPRYIHPRKLVRDESVALDPARAEGTTLDEERRALIARADTAFVASGHAERGLDVSHKAGKPGFIQAHGNQLVIPEFPGNGMFNTLGNLAVDPHVGIVVVDFERGRHLKMRGKASIAIDGESRLWMIDVEEWRDEPAPAAYRWET